MHIGKTRVVIFTRKAKVFKYRYGEATNKCILTFNSIYIILQECKEAYNIYNIRYSSKFICIGFVITTNQLNAWSRII